MLSHLNSFRSNGTSKCTFLKRSFTSSFSKAPCFSVRYYSPGLSRENLRMVPLGAGLAPGCGVPAASFSCTGDTAARNTASGAAEGPPLPRPAAAADTPSDAPTTLVSPALVSTGSHSVPWVTINQSTWKMAEDSYYQTLRWRVFWGFIARKKTSLSCSLRCRYCRFWDSSRLVNSFFCWVSMCCWNFFSSVRTAFDF